MQSTVSILLRLCLIAIPLALLIQLPAVQLHRSDDDSSTHAAGTRSISYRGLPQSLRRLAHLPSTGDAMTRIELLRLLVGQARANGFEFRKWYTTRLARPWVDAQQAIHDLAVERRYYALLFSHEFASNFWKTGHLITFQVPQQSFNRRKADGSIGVVQRKAYTRRTARDDVWRYHLQQLAIADEPLRYMRRYLRVEDDRGPASFSDLLPGSSKDSAGISPISLPPEGPQERLS